MKMMTDKEALLTDCPLLSLGNLANAGPGAAKARCRGQTCQLWVTSPADETRGRCSFAFGAMGLFSVPAAIGDSVFNALENVRAKALHG